MATTIEDGLARSIARAERAYAAEHATDGPRTVRRIRRRRGAVVAGTVTAIVAAAGLAASVAAAMVGHHDPADNGPKPLTVTFVPGSLVLPNSTHATWYCGKEPPEVAPITGEFALTVNPTPWVDDLSAVARDASGALVWPDHPNAAVLTTRGSGGGAVITGWLFVQDGIVVAYWDAIDPGNVDMRAGSIQRWSPGTEFPLSGGPLATSCTPASDSGVVGYPPLPAGEYEAYPIVRIVSSIQTDAALVLADLGASETSVESGGAGSWDCRQAIANHGLVPVNCLDANVFDPATDQATVEVPAEKRNPARDVLLVGTPIPYTVTGVAPSFAPPEPLAEPAFAVCDAEPASEAQRSLDLYASATAIVNDPSGPLDASILGDADSDGMVSFPTGLDVSVTRFPLSGGPSGVVGRGHATIDGGGRLILDRYAGPTKVSLVITSLEWCGDRPAGGIYSSYVSLDGEEAVWTDHGPTVLVPISAFVDSPLAVTP